MPLLPSNVTAQFESSEFETGIRHVLEETHRAAPEVVNQAALNVAGRAMNKTMMTDKPAMVIALGGVFAVSLKMRNGKLVAGKKIRYVTSEAPLAAILVNVQRAKLGLPGLYGPDMRRAADQLIAARRRAVGFNRSGWLPAIRRLAAVLPNPFIIAHLSGIAIYGQTKGSAIPAPARASDPEAVIENDVDTITITGTRALEEALDEEGREMQAHAEKRFEQISQGL